MEKRENIGEKVYDVGFGNEFLVMTPKAHATKESINKLDYIKTNFLASKDTIHSEKEIHKIGENIFRPYI